jgi:seryl-tRNA synthetase
MRAALRDEFNELYNAIASIREQQRSDEISFQKLLAETKQLASDLQTNIIATAQIKADLTHRYPDVINPLCWVWNGKGENPKTHVRRIETQEGADYVDNAGDFWDHAVHIKPEEL